LSKWKGTALIPEYARVYIVPKCEHFILNSKETIKSKQRKEKCYVSFKNTPGIHERNGFRVQRSAFHSDRVSFSSDVLFFTDQFNCHPGGKNGPGGYNCFSTESVSGARL
jgi:hypothetical protein